MKFWYAALLLLCCTLSLGCRTSQHVAALQRDNRLKEDEIYRLRWQLQDYAEALESQQQSGEGQSSGRGQQTESGLSGGRGSSSGSRTERPLLERLGAPAATSGSTTRDIAIDVGESISANEFLQARDVDVPQVEMPSAAASSAAASSGGGTASGAGPSFSLPGMSSSDAGRDSAPLPPTWGEPDEAPAADEAPRWSPRPSGARPPEVTPDTRWRVPATEPDAAATQSAATQPGATQPGAGPAAPSRRADPLAPEESRRVTQLQIDAEATRGHTMDAQPGDDGLHVVFHAMDEDGRSLSAPAAVSIVVLDPAFTGEAARVARWDFTADEVAAAIRASGTEGGGIPLKVVWRERLPQNEALHLFVRYTTADGRKLEDRVEVRVRLSASPASAGWKTAPRQAPPAPPEEDRSTSTPEPPAQHTRFASRTSSVASDAPPAQPRLERPRWSPNRP